MELPTASLLDGTGHVDAELFPNIGALASTSTWYRNHTTVAAFTSDAVPAILTGRNPEDGAPPRRATSENLFTLLGGLYDMHVREEVTRLCPGEICPRDASEGVGSLLDEAVTWWQGEDREEAVEFDLKSGSTSIANLTPESIAETYAKIESIDGFSEPGPFEPGS